MTKITVKTNGSIRVEGEFELFDINGNKFDLSGRQAISLCRCGHSNNLPFCDSRHKEENFSSEIVARVYPLPGKP